MTRSKRCEILACAAMTEEKSRHEGCSNTLTLGGAWLGGLGRLPKGDD